MALTQAEINEVMQQLQPIIAKALNESTSIAQAQANIQQGVTQYIGARYVPLFAAPIEWDNTRAYEPLTIVLYQGNSFTTRQYTPSGVDINNEAFWAETGNYNAQIELYRQEVKKAHNLAKEAMNTYATISDLKSSSNVSEGDVVYTEGFYTNFDGGGNCYLISQSGSNDNKMSFKLNNGLYANVVVANQYYKPIQFGDNTTDIAYIQYMIDNDIKVDGNYATYTPTTQIALNPNSSYLKNVVFDCSNVNGLFKRGVFCDTVCLKHVEVFNSLTRVSEGFSLDGAIALNCRKGIISNCKIHDCAGNGLMLYNDNNKSQFCEDVNIKDSVSYKNGKAATGLGIGAYLSPNALDTHLNIDNCIAHHNVNSGIAPHGINNTVVTNCKSCDNSEHGVVAQDCTNFTCCNNVIINNAGGVRIQGNWLDDNAYAHKVIVSNNVIKSPNVLPIGWHVDEVVISNNIIQSTNPQQYVLNFDSQPGRKTEIKDVCVVGNVINCGGNRFVRGTSYLINFVARGNTFTYGVQNNEQFFNPQSPDYSYVGCYVDDIRYAKNDLLKSNITTYNGTFNKGVATLDSRNVICRFGNNIPTTGINSLAMHIDYTCDKDNPLILFPYFRLRKNNTLVKDIEPHNEMWDNINGADLACHINISTLKDAYDFDSIELAIYGIPHTSEPCRATVDTLTLLTL